MFVLVSKKLTTATLTNGKRFETETYKYSGVSDIEETAIAGIEQYTLTYGNNQTVSFSQHDYLISVGKEI